MTEIEWCFVIYIEVVPFAFFQPIFPDGDVRDKDHDLLPRDTAGSRDPDVFLEPKIPDHTAEYVHRIIDLEG
jgi:hypothetical protein